jgi:hypothetical protein
LNQYSLNTTAFSFVDVAGEVRVAMPPARVDGLVPATGYLLRVAAENRIGRSEPSAGVKVVTLEEPPSGPPLNLKVSLVHYYTFYRNYYYN